MRVDLCGKFMQETRNQKVAADAAEIFLYGGMRFDGKIVFVNKLDGTLATLKVSLLRQCILVRPLSLDCSHLSLVHY